MKRIRVSNNDLLQFKKVINGAKISSNQAIILFYLSSLTKEVDDKLAVYFSSLETLMKENNVEITPEGHYVFESQELTNKVNDLLALEVDLEKGAFLNQDDFEVFLRNSEIKITMAEFTLLKNFLLDEYSPVQSV